MNPNETKSEEIARLQEEHENETGALLEQASSGGFVAFACGVAAGLIVAALVFVVRSL